MAVQPTWFERDLPVLAGAVTLLNELGGPGVVNVSSIAERIGRDPQEVYSSLLALRDGYVTMTLMMAPDPGIHLVTGVTAEARRVVGQWPTPEGIADQLLAALKAASDRTTDLEQQSKLRAAAETLGGFGRDVMVGVVSTVIAAHV
jgi:hypothetical protein